MIFTRSPCRSSQARPSLRPAVYDARSPATAHAHVMAISNVSEISPWPATTPPTITVVSPGAIRPMNAPVSRKARMPTTR